MDIKAIKQRFGIIGNSSELERAIDIARQVAPTDISVLVTGESGVGKEYFPKIIHQLSARKHGPYIAVNCGAIPEGTIESELFGHEKGSFTGASDSRKGYFEEGNGGTIFLDEVAELPLSTQVRLLRVLETGEFLRVGSSKVLRTNVRIVAATNENMNDAIASGRFRQDLFYRMSTVPIFVPALRERGDDVYLLFRKFASDFAEKYRMPPIVLTERAKAILLRYRWPGNIRQLKNITEQMSIIEREREVNEVVIAKYLPQENMSELPVLYSRKSSAEEITDRDILYKVLVDMKKDMREMKKIVTEIINSNDHVSSSITERGQALYKDFTDDILSDGSVVFSAADDKGSVMITPSRTSDHIHMPLEEAEAVEESYSLQSREIDIIKKALEKHNGRRKTAAQELGISERTLYRKIKEYNL